MSNFRGQLGAGLNSWTYLVFLSRIWVESSVMRFVEKAHIITILGKSSGTHSYSATQGPLGICHHIAMAVAQNLMCATPLSAKWEVSLFCDITRSTRNCATWHPRHKPPQQQYATNRWSIPDALLRRLRLRSLSPQSNAYPAQAMKSGEISSSKASRPVGRMSLLMSVWQIRTPRRIGPGTPTKSLPRRSERRRRSTCSPVSNSASTSLLLSFPQMGWSGVKQESSSKDSPCDSPTNGSARTPLSVVSWVHAWASRLSVQLTFVFGDRESPSHRSAAVLTGRIGLVLVCSKQTTKLSVLKNYQFSNPNAILEFPYKPPSPILLLLEGLRAIGTPSCSAICELLAHLLKRRIAFLLHESIE
jgi:hypothetical protein